MKRDPGLPGLSAGDVLTAVRAAYRIGLLDVLLRSARQSGASEIRLALEAERRHRLEELRSAGMTEVVFTDVA